jgi:hypothetical protein
MALTRDDGDDPGESISRMKLLGIFVGIPVAAMALIWLLVSIPSMVRGPRYRPGKEWKADAEWYGAPGTDQAAIEGGGDPALEGRPADSALTGTVVEPSEGGTDSAGGGTSARW